MGCRFGIYISARPGCVANFAKRPSYVTIIGARSAGEYQIADLAMFISLALCGSMSHEKFASSAPPPTFFLIQVTRRFEVPLSLFVAPSASQNNYKESSNPANKLQLSGLKYIDRIVFTRNPRLTILISSLCRRSNTLMRFPFELQTASRLPSLLRAISYTAFLSFTGMTSSYLLWSSEVFSTMLNGSFAGKASIKFVSL